MVVIENIIDEERRVNSFGLLLSLLMLLLTPEGSDSTPSELIAIAKEVGFAQVDMMHLAGPASAMIARKP